ncbi:MAG: LLM class flavin-dependent oxidoreductase [Solirubrobacteraceae bacterium]|nr:LLM class flavin-dependent oxidoreductase [Solirubrobacteraceae bacterium]
MTVPLSLLDLASVGDGQPVGEALAETVTFARKAEELGYSRVWYAEHHNMRSIASSAPAVLIAHVAAHTQTIRLGSGGVMLPNHAPLVIAEQFGTLGALHPGRIDLGLGRAPGTDGRTLWALRRTHEAAETFPQDVLELQGYLRGETRVEGVNAQPGFGIDVPLYMLGSSLFGAKLAAALGLPYAFASHFSPGALLDAARIYREEFKPSEQLAAPHFIAAVNVLAADTDEEAERQFQARRRMLARVLFGGGPGRPLTPDEIEAVIASPSGAQVEAMMQYTATGKPDAVGAYLSEFAELVAADELITVHQADSLAGRLRSLELVASVADLKGAAAPA